jgi:hypothetical protein
MKQAHASAIPSSVEGPVSHAIPKGSEANPQTFSTDSPRSERKIAAREIGVFVAALMVPGLIVLGAASYHVVATRIVLGGTADRAEQRIQVSERTRGQLQTELTDSGLAADIATMRAYQKALTDELEATNERLKSDPGDRTFLKRGRLLEVLLSNAGGTGINDRLAAIDTAQRMIASRTVSTEFDEATVREAMKNLRSSAASWKTGAFANAGKLVGLRWEEGKGLVSSTPYVWGESGWETDPGWAFSDSSANK